ncbi:MAG: pyridoxal 5'-phosphate synthase glutaminase subunit PdxT [Calditrichaeota bacterium]|nr:MAG: pyridoxal 5'-phosphate synthase glutaminase subunit PdxT [Calditrichota bacterium]
MKIGILALQGDFELHSKALARLSVEVQLVRKPDQLTQCSGLIIPGGESTTFIRLLKAVSLYQAIRDFARERPVFGTCAGLIVLAKRVTNYPLETLGLIDISVERNAYGRQIDSFIDRVRIQLNGTSLETEGVFIRAPKIVELGPGVRPLGWHGEDVVMAEEGHILVATFHPELTEEAAIHRYFVEKARHSG